MDNFREKIKQAFSKNWKSGGKETPCGGGSLLSTTREIRDALPRIIKKYNIKSINDAGCGDFNWVLELKEFFIENNIDYLGYDIVKRNDLMPFVELEITSEIMRTADLIICRDVMIHLSNDLVLSSLTKFKESGATWLLASSYDSANNDSRRGFVGGCSTINLEKEPFNLKKPLERINETRYTRYIGLWSIS